VARISGEEAFEIVNRVWRGKNLNKCATHTAHFGSVVNPTDGEELDQAVATVFRAPRSFTGENVVELSVHGSRWIQRELINLLISNGARMAEPGEFTRRAVANGKLDLAEAEAVADMIAASSRSAQRIAIAQMRGDYSRRLSSLHDQLLRLAALVELELDFSEEDVEFADRRELISLTEEIHQTVSRMAQSFANGRALKEGVPVAIVGATNAGKSTLLNRLLGDDKAIVSDIHGTTRDIIEDSVELNGTLFRFNDTAGLRRTTDPIESIGIDRSLDAIRRASIIIWVIDPQQSAENIAATWQQIEPNVDAGAHLIMLHNKADLKLPKPDGLPNGRGVSLRISAKSGDIAPLIEALTQAVATDTPADMMVTNARHYQALTLAADSTVRALAALRDGIPGDLIAQDIRETIHHLASITNPITTPAILSHIFENFCIGK
jgi:tRNA modification GTPase